MYCVRIEEKRHPKDGDTRFLRKVSLHITPISTSVLCSQITKFRSLRFVSKIRPRVIQHHILGAPRRCHQRGSPPLKLCLQSSSLPNEVSRHDHSIVTALTLLWIAWCRSQWPRGLRRGSTAARLLGLWVRIPPRAWMSVSCECCVLSGRGLCNGLVPRPGESYRVWCV
jgi:hypothetical protein